jgi:ferritin-like metal-binding protein YciE
MLVEELRDIYHAEKQITKALPKMIKAATSEQLKAGFENHLEETHGQIERLEQCFELLEERVRGKTCEAMRGIIEEASETMKEDMEPEVLDAALVASAQKVEHYEIACYGTVMTWAENLGLDKVARLLSATLDEEKATDVKLTQLATRDINPRAAKAGMAA